MPNDKWRQYKDDPLTPEELQRTRENMGRTDALWFLWGWLASAAQDGKAWAAAAAVAGLLWGPQVVEAVRKLMGVAP